MTVQADRAPPGGWPEELEVAISALEHYSYCPRQCALIHVEQTFTENVFTVRGRLAHERVDQAPDESRGDVRVARSLPLWSERLGLRGKADVVEFRANAPPFPVEYKVGRKRGPHADVQLCAQALCLEEMLDTGIPDGAVYSHAQRRRHPVTFTPELRARTEQIVAEIRAMLVAQRLPAAPNDRRCPSCSLIDACLPQVAAEPARLRGLQGALFRPQAPGPDDA